MQTLLAFLVALALLIAVHEYGHYRMAVACGVRVLRFSLGFGKVLWRYRPRQQKAGQDTEFVICMLPLGGYVKMLDEREGEVAPDARHLAFNNQSLAKRVAIVAAGPLANLLLAVVLFSVAQWWGISQPKAIVGAPPVGSVAHAAGLQAGDEVLAVGHGQDALEAVTSLDDLQEQLLALRSSGEVVMEAHPSGSREGVRRSLVFRWPSVSQTTDDDPLVGPREQLGLHPFVPPVLADVVPAGPAQAAGLQKGDEVLRIGAERVEDGAQLRALIRAQVDGVGRPRQHEWLVQRAGRQLVLSVTPEVVKQQGVWVAKVGVMVGGSPTMVTVRRGAWDGLVHGVGHTWRAAKLTVQMIGQMLIGQASIKNLSGPLSIADYAGKSAAHGVSSYVLFLALLSVSLGVLNLLPLPILDGGHLMYYLWEAVTGRAVSDVWQARWQQVGLVLLLSLMSVALFNDVLRLWG